MAQVQVTVTFADGQEMLRLLDALPDLPEGIEFGEPEDETSRLFLVSVDPRGGATGLAMDRVTRLVQVAKERTGLQGAYAEASAGIDPAIG